jgi:hypothetical protein
MTNSFETICVELDLLIGEWEKKLSFLSKAWAGMDFCPE